ncbi:MAG: hypothetical protein ACRDOL_16020 [Streptosporangiaceae bacterium]
MPASEYNVTLRLTLRGKGETVVAKITGPAVENGPQAVGDFVLLALEQHALEQHADDAAEATGGLIGALGERTGKVTMSWRTSSGRWSQRGHFWP